MDNAALVQACVIVIAMSMAGVMHGVWLRSGASRRFDVPLDGGRTFRGRRIFGDNKTVRGLMVIVPAAGAAFALLGFVRDAGVAWLQPGLWDLDPAALFGVGAWAGFCFMAGELPNSFAKRQAGIGPGEAPARGWARRICLVVDRVDSTLALLLGLGAAVGLHGQTWVAVLVLGPAVHFGFSALLCVVGVKARFA